MSTGKKGTGAPCPASWQLVYQRVDGGSGEKHLDRVGEKKSGKELRTTKGGNGPA